jgi:glycosyltransferase involved in cell wall biosynthesis
MSGQRPLLLGVGFAEEGFGFGRVFRSLYARLASRWDIEHLEFSPPRDAAPQTPWRVHHTKRPAVYLGHHEFAELVNQRQPQIIFFSLDLWQLPAYLRALDDVVCKPGVIAYCPIDGVVSGGTQLLDLERLDRLVTPTHFGKATLLKEFQRFDGLSHVRVDVIPHGIDADRFFAYCDHDGRNGSRRARAELFPGQPELEDAFIVLNANRNQMRKQLDLTLEGFSLFAQGKPSNVKLYLHSGISDEGINTVAFAEKLRILDRVLPTTNKRSHPVVSDEQLNRIYNACAVGVNTSLGEGWGLVAFEHAATRAAQILPRHSACGELWQGAASLLPTTPVDTSLGGYFQGASTTAESVAAALEQLYGNRSLLERQAQAAFGNAHCEQLQWDAVAGRFGRLFDEILGSMNSEMKDDCSINV